jgi:hypothetical protein
MLASKLTCPENSVIANGELKTAHLLTIETVRIQRVTFKLSLVNS